MVSRCVFKENKKIDFDAFATVSIFVLVVAAIFIAGCNTPSQADIGGNVVLVPLVSQEAGSIKTFVLTGDNFNFVMDDSKGPELRVNEGDKVRVEFTSTDGFHDFVVDEFKAATQKVRAGNSTSVEFLADRKGTFEYYCSVGSHRQQGMKGNLVVE